MGRNIDIAGQKFNRLTGVARVRKAVRGGSGHQMWQFLCDCGASVIRDKWNVIYGKTKSCGCARREYWKSLKGHGIK